MTFQWPLALLSLLIVPIIVLLYMTTQRKRRKYTVRFTNVALLENVVGKSPGMRRHVPPILFLLALTALLLSLARPVAVLAVPRDQATVILVMDTSGSMSAQDLTPNRMEAAKQAAKQFVNALPENVQIGLVTFNDEIAVRSPLTRDHEAVRKTIDRLDAGGGTAIGDGLNSALDQLKDLPKNEKGERAPATVVLISDGENTTGTEPAVASERAKKELVKVHTVGIGDRTSGSFVNRNQYVGLDEDALKNMANQTGGRYYYAAEAQALQQIYTELSRSISWVQEKTEVTALVSALGTVLMLAGGMLSLHWFQRFP